MAAELKRKNIRLPADSYFGRKFYFLTLCFEPRRRSGVNSRVATWLIARLQKHSAASGFFVHAYCIMPDHMHILASAASDASNLMAFVESFKQETAYEFVRRTHRGLWQFKYYDRILRNSDSPESVAWYIWLNPVRKGLCRAPMEYPFLGSFTEVGKTTPTRLNGWRLDAALEKEGLRTTLHQDLKTQDAPLKGWRHI